MISRTDLNQAVQSVLSFLAEYKINSISDLERLAEQNLVIGDSNQAHIYISNCVSNLNTTAPTISYIIPAIGIVLDIKTNNSLGYCSLLTKGNFSINGYKIFAKDPSGNLIQQKKIYSTEIQVLKSELSDLLSN